MSKKNNLSDKSEKDLVTEVGVQREAIRAFRFSVSGSSTRDVRAVRTAKKEVARGLTELNRRKREERSKAV